MRLLALLLFLSIRVFAQADANLTLTVDGVERTYILHTPTDVVTPAPLVIALHGGGGDAAGLIRVTHLDEASDANGFLVAFPEALNKNWNDGRGSGSRPRSDADDTAFLTALIDELVAHHGADLDRVCVTGISNGGFMSMRMGCDAAGKIAAIAPVAANLTQDILDSCAPARPLPVMLINGTDDPLIPFEGGRGILRNIVGVVLPSEQTAAYWAQNAGCAETYTPIQIENQEQPDRTQAERRIFDGCPDGVPVEHYVLAGGGHTWPGGTQYLGERLVGITSRDFDASQTIWDFFAPLTLSASNDSAP